MNRVEYFLSLLLSDHNEAADEVSNASENEEVVRVVEKYWGDAFAEEMWQTVTELSKEDLRSRLDELSPPELILVFVLLQPDPKRSALQFTGRPIRPEVVEGVRMFLQRLVKHGEKYSTFLEELDRAVKEVMNARIAVINAERPQA